MNEQEKQELIRQLFMAIKQAADIGDKQSIMNSIVLIEKIQAEIEADRTKVKNTNEKIKIEQKEKAL